jgi:hypothetical protein
MKTKGEELRDEIARVTEEHGRKYPSMPTVFPPELVRRVAAYAREQMAQGKAMAECSQELGLPKARLHYWVYDRSKRASPPGPAAVLRPVKVSSELVPVYDGVPERRYVFRSPAGWEIRELTLEELTELLRRLA